MKTLALTWNVSRTILIILCSYQVTLALLDSMQAARMLQITEGPESHRATQAPLDASRVIDVLNRRGHASWGWLAVLGALALIPYAPVFGGSSRQSRVAEKSSSGQLATGSEFNSDGSDKSQPELESRSQ